MECSTATAVVPPPASTTTTPKKLWVSKDEDALNSFSLRFAYAWVCSVVASVISLGPSSKGKLANNKDEQQLSTKDLNNNNNNNNSLSPTTTTQPRKQELYKTVTPPPNLKRKTLILDLDETLVHSTIKAVTHHHITVDVLIDGMTCTFYVIKRPHVDLFLKKVAEWFDLIIFTASMQQYADPLIDQLDTNKLVKGRLFRESCLAKEGNFVKDLSLIGQDLTSTIIVDNSPIAYSHNKENALPIDNWMGDNPQDDALLNLLPFLNGLRFTSDVRSILSLRGN